MAPADSHVIMGSMREPLLQHRVRRLASTCHGVAFKEQAGMHASMQCHPQNLQNKAECKVDPRAVLLSMEGRGGGNGLARVALVSSTSTTSRPDLPSWHARGKGSVASRQAACSSCVYSPSPTRAASGVA